MKLFRNRTFLALLAILLAAGLCFGIAPALSKASNRQTQIVRAVKSIPEGTAVTKDMVQTVSVGSFGLPANVLKAPENVVGKYTTAELQPGDYILSTKVSDKSQSPYLSSLDGTKQAISIEIKSFAAGLSGKLQPGDVVSMIVSNYGQGKQTLAPAELKYVKLLAATNAQGVDTDQVKKDEKDDSAAQNQSIPATLTLLVNPEQAAKLVDYAANGSLYATLVYRGTEENADQYLQAQQSYFDTKDDEAVDSAQDGTTGTPNSTAGTGGAPTNGR